MTLTISTENSNLIAEVADFRARLFAAPEAVNPMLLAPVELRILVVLDSSLHFNMSEFGLQTFITVLVPRLGPYVRPRITTACRESFPHSPQTMGCGLPGVVGCITGFSFSNPEHFASDKYDEVWLFGYAESVLDVRGSWTNMPSVRELRAVCDFMDGGGGLFATGDHGALGGSLGGHIPRARSMRLWFESAGPFGEPAAPHMNNALRNDTVTPGHNAAYQFDDQSDDVPQRIHPRYYSQSSGGGSMSFPHPILDGRTGVIDVLPDHPHEGVCVAPYETNRTEFGPPHDRFHFVEYPPSDDGTGQVLPEVIAHSQVVAGNQVKDRVGQTRQFGAICAYDGARAGVGRVVTDATWHHFVNVNLVGRHLMVADPEPCKQFGFLGTAEGRAHFEKIKEYYRNLALWLAPAPLRNQIVLRCIWTALWQERLVEAVTPGIIRPLTEIDLHTLLWAGRHTGDVVGQLIGPAFLREWLLWLFRDTLNAEALKKLDPWRAPSTTAGTFVEEIWVDYTALLDLALGGAALKIREVFPNEDPTVKERAERDLMEIVKEGAFAGMRLGLDAIEASAAGLSSLATSITILPG